MALVFAFAATMKIVGGIEQGSVAATLVGRIPGGEVLLIAAEIVLALWLLSGWKPAVSIGLTLAVLALFSGVLTREVLRDRPRPCGCGAWAWQTQMDARQSLRRSLMGNAAMAGLAGVTLLVRADTKRRPRPAQPSADGSVPATASD